MTYTAVAVPALSKHMEAEMFDKKEDNSTSTTDVFRPAKGSAKVVIGHGVQITGEIKKSDEVQIDGEADVTMKTDNLVVGVTGNCKGDIETHNADVWGEFDGDIKAHTDHVLKEIQKALEKNGSSMEKVLKVNVYLADLADYKAMNEVYRGRFGPNPPVRTTVATYGGVPGNSLVEIDCIAALD